MAITRVNLKKKLKSGMLTLLNVFDQENIDVCSEIKVYEYTDNTYRAIILHKSDEVMCEYEGNTVDDVVSGVVNKFYNFK